MNQTLNDFEIIVIDDGSIDQGSVIVKEYKDVMLIRQSNLGVAAARNAGVAAANGNWIAFLDADDMWFPNHLFEIKRAINFNENADMVGTRYIEAMTSSFIKQPIQPESNIRTIDYFKEASSDIGVIWSSAVSVKRTAFLKSGGFENYSMGEDLRCWARLALKGSVSISNSITSVYFRGTGGAMEREANTDIKILKKKDIIRPELSSISPACALLNNALSNDEYCRYTESIHLYLNSRVISAINHSLYNGDVRTAKQYSSLLRKPTGLIPKLTKLIKFVPNIFLNKAVIHFMIRVR